jgi:hypothetical protein
MNLDPRCWILDTGYRILVTRFSSLTSQIEGEINIYLYSILKIHQFFLAPSIYINKGVNNVNLSRLEKYLAE